MFTSKVYSMQAGEKGKGMIMVENNGKPELPIGCSVYTFGAGMSECDAVVISASDEHGAQKCVTVSDYEDNQRFFTIDKYSRPLSKKFGIGNYYDDELTVSYSKEQIEEAIRKAATAQANRQAASDAKDKAYAEEIAAMPSLHPHLKPLTSNGFNGDRRAFKAARKSNLVAHLVKNFAGIYFSVRNEHGDTYNISWENGPTDHEVSEVLNQFKDSYFDGMTDSTVHYRNAFADVFGSFDYLFTRRSWSSDIDELWNANKHLMGNSDRDWFNRAFDKQSFPAGAKITGFDDDNNQFTFAIPEAKPLAPANDEGIPSDIEIADYSERAIVVRGNTKPIKDQLKSLGGKFNFRLQGGAGWIFPKREEARIRQALSLIDTGTDQGGNMLDAMNDQASDDWCRANNI